MRSTEPVDHLCNGVRVRSFIPLGGRVVEPAGAADVVIEPGEVRTRALAEGQDADWYVEDGALILTIRGVARYRAEGGRRIVIDAEPGGTLRDVSLYLGGSVLGAIWLQRGVLPLHGSAVAVAGGCVVFVGPSGAGKSSLAAHFASAGFPLVADDVSVLADRAGGFSVWPGVSRVKLATDAIESLDTDSSALVRTGGTREKYHLEVPGLAGEPAPVPLRGIFLLSYGSGTARTERLAGLDAIDVVGGHTYRQEFVGPLGLEPIWLRKVVEVARIVPAIRLIRPFGYQRTNHVIEVVLSTLEACPLTEVQ